jgi:hypothetical protein
MADPSLQQLNPNVVFYSDTFISIKQGAVDRLEGIKLKLASIGIGKARTDGLAQESIHHYQRWVDSTINSALTAVYTIPVVRITREGRNLNQSNTAIAFFPDPIPEIATAMVAAQIVFHEYTDIDPNSNEAANALFNAAEDRLRELVGIDGQIGTFRLEGQQLRTRHPFAPPGVMPLNTLKPR